MINFNLYGDVKQDTGFDEEILQYIYVKYCGITTPIPNPHLLYRINYILIPFYLTTELESSI